MTIIIYIWIIRLYYLSEIMLMRHPILVVYIYLGILWINTLVNIILLRIVDVDTTSLINSINNSSLEIDGPKIILKIFPDNSDLAQGDIKAIDNESNKKIDSVDVNNIKDKGKIHKKGTFMNEMHRQLVFMDDLRSRCRMPWNENCPKPIIPKDVPVYGSKLVTFKPTSILHNRNLPGMSIEIPKNTSIGMGKITELHKAIEGADDAVKLYDSQFIKFNKVLCDIKNGTEKFYPDEAKPLMKTYVDLVSKLSDQQKDMANEAITQLRKLDSKFSRDLYHTGNSGQGSNTGIGTGRVPVTGTGTGSGTGSDSGSSSGSGFGGTI